MAQNHPGFGMIMVQRARIHKRRLGDAQGQKLIRLGAINGRGHNPHFGGIGGKSLAQIAAARGGHEGRAGGLQIAFGVPGGQWLAHEFQLLADVGPKPLRRIGARKQASHADNGDIAAGLCSHSAAPAAAASA